MPRPTGPAVANAAPPVWVELALAEPEAVEEPVVFAAEAAADEEALADAELEPLATAALLELWPGGTSCEETPAGTVATAGCDVTTEGCVVTAVGCVVTTVGWPVTTPLELVSVRYWVAGLLYSRRVSQLSQARRRVQIQDQ